MRLESNRRRPDTQRWSRRRGQRGAGSIEYLALFAIVALTITVPLAATAKEGVLVKAVQWGICKAYNQGLQVLGLPQKDCGPDPSQLQKLPPCVTYQQDRLLGVNGTFRFIRGEVTGKDTIVDTIDPATGKEVSYVFLKNEAGAGVEAKDGGKGNLASKLDGAGIGVNGKAVVQGGTGVVYKFDSHDEAQQFLDDRRGNILKRSVGVITGGKAEALYDGARKGLKKLGGLVGIGDGEDHGPTPSGVTAELAVQADAGISFEKGPAGKKVDFRADAKALGRANGQFRYNFDGTSQMEVRWEGELQGNAGVGIDKETKKKLPFLGDLSATAGGNLAGASGYRIMFDKNGKPTNFILTTESGGGWQYKVGADRAHKGGKSDEITVNTYNLDLTVPENLEALQQSLPTLAQNGGVVNPITLMTTDTPLMRRVHDDSVQYEQKYDVEGDVYAGSSPNGDKEKGIKIKGVGIGFNDDTTKRTLTSARYIDHRQPDGTWQNLAKCTKK